jgi:hypothetical protein
MTARRLQIDILGPRPNEVDIEELSVVLEDLHKAISSCISPPGKESANDFAARVSLVGIVDGSDGLVLEVQPRAVNALGQINRALSTRSYSDLPRSAHEALFRVNQYLVRRKWGLRMRRNTALGIVPIDVITADHVLPPAERATISGGTTLLARCLRVGGATTPRAELRLSNKKLLHVEVNEAVARELGKRLYDQVVLSGEAVWDARDGELKEFRVTDVSTFRAVPIDVAFRELAAAADGRWNDVDANLFVKQVRESTA